MKSWLVAAVMLAAALSFATAGETARKGKKEVLREMMIEAHRGEASPLAVVAAESKKDSPRWPELERALKKLTTMGKELPKLASPYTDSSEYIKSVAALAVSVDKRDQGAMAEAHKRLMVSCSACHYGLPKL